MIVSEVIEQKISERYKPLKHCGKKFVEIHVVIRKNGHTNEHVARYHSKGAQRGPWTKDFKT